MLLQRARKTKELYAHKLADPSKSLGLRSERDQNATAQDRRIISRTYEIFHKLVHHSDKNNTSEKTTNHVRYGATHTLVAPL